MEEKVKKFVKLVEELTNLGNDITANYEDELDVGVFEEIDAMSAHCGCCLRILREEGVVE